MPRYTVWLLAAGCVNLGNQAAIFGLAWSASGKSAALAGTLLAAAAVPRIGLTVAGGVVADRFGPLHVLTACGSVLTTAGMVGVLTGHIFDEPTWLLLCLALFLGTVSAFYIPAAGVMPRLLTDTQRLPRAMASWQIVLQLTTLTAAPIAGVVVELSGLTGILAILVIAGAVLLVVAVNLRNTPVGTRAGSRQESYLAQLRDGWRIVSQERVIRDLIILLTAVSGFLIPVTTLLVPLLARERNWSPGMAGSIAAGFTAGSIIVSVSILILGAFASIGGAVIAGLITAATGVAALAVSPTVLPAVVSAAVAGAGTSLFTSHAGPLLIGAAPGTHVARVQATMLLAQNVPLLFANTGIGLVAAAWSATGAAIVCTAGILLAASLAAWSDPVRRARRPVSADAPSDNDLSVSAPSTKERQGQ